MKKVESGIIATVTGGQEVGVMTTCHAAADLIPHALFLKSKTTRKYPEGDPRNAMYEFIDEVAFTVHHYARAFAFSMLHTGIGVAQARFGVAPDTIDDILRSDAVGLADFSIQSVTSLRQYIPNDRLLSHIPFFLLAPPDDILAARLKRRELSPKEINTRLLATKALEQEARSKNFTPWVFIENDKEANVVARRIHDAIKTHRRLHKV